MNTRPLFAANIDNLTSLWKAMGARSIQTGEGSAVHTSTSWPHRLWVDELAQPSPGQAATMLEIAQGSARSLVLPVWSDDDWAHELRAASHELSFEQTVMTLDLNRWADQLPESADTTLRRVDGRTGTWAQLASLAFGYTVDEAVTDRVAHAPGVTLVVAEQNSRAVGTGLIYESGEIAGVHMVGVLPAARRRGVARKIMTHLLHQARSRGLRHAALQASPMGEGLYRELGFEPLGKILNFTRYPTRSAGSPPSAHATDPLLAH